MVTWTSWVSSSGVLTESYVVEGANPAMSCAPQHMKTKRSGSATSVAPVTSSTTTVRLNSNATVTPLRFTGASVEVCVTTSETYISRAAASRGRAYPKLYCLT